MNAILKYPGAKNRIANWIIEYIPEHKVYIEPYAGSLAVLLNKPRARIETVNDVVNFFKVVREHAEELAELLEFTPYARTEYDTDDVFVYLDPPYLPKTRKGYLYKHEMTESDHVELLKVVVKHPGRFLISGYDNELYNDMLIGWNKVKKDTTAEKGLKRTETLWFNYEIGQQSLCLEKG